MELNPHNRLQKLTIGRERAPLLVIDDFAREPERLIRWAASRHFTCNGRFYPGIRTKAPRTYQHSVLRELKPLLLDFFELEADSLVFSMCHYSLVTTRAEDLVMEQRLPHIDSVDGSGLASIHYLFRAPLGGTAFYRHRQTGFEYVDAGRKQAYFRALEREVNGPHAPAAGYINGDTPLYEQVASQEGIFNRILFYRRNSLHSGCIDRAFSPDADPATGRLSINSFIDVARRPSQAST